MYWIKENESLEVIQKYFDFKTVTDNAIDNAESEKSLIMKLFAKLPTPTWNEYKAWRKENKMVAVSSNTVGFTGIFTMLDDCRIIREQQTSGFDVLSYWNNEQKTAQKKREPSISKIKKGALAFKNGANEITPEEKATKYAVTFYNSLQPCKGKKWIVANDKMVALMTGLGIAIPEPKTETETK